MSSVANYNGKQPNNTSYIKNFVPGTSPNIWQVLKYNPVTGENTGIITPTSTINKDLYITGNLYVNESIINPSDRNLKKNIIEISDVQANNILNLKPSEFVFKLTPSIKHYGFIAQEVETYYPELVFERPSIRGQPKVKSINYLEIIPLLVKKIQLMQDEINSLKDAVGPANLTVGPLTTAVEALNTSVGPANPVVGPLITYVKNLNDIVGPANPVVGPLTTYVKNLNDIVGPVNLTVGPVTTAVGNLIGIVGPANVNIRQLTTEVEALKTNGGGSSNTDVTNLTTAVDLLVNHDKALVAYITTMNSDGTTKSLRDEEPGSVKSLQEAFIPSDGK